MGLGFRKNEKSKKRPPSAVLRKDHEKRKIRPSSFVQDRGPVLGKDLRSEAGKRSEERKETFTVHRPPRRP